MSYSDFLVRTESGAEIHIPVEELLRILLSGYMPDGTAYDGVKIVSIPAITGEVSIDQTTPGTTNGVVVNDIAAGTAIIGQVGIDQTIPGTTNAVAAKFIDESGSVYGIKHVDNKPRISSMPYLYDIAEGNVADHSASRLFGINPSVGATWETVHSPSTLRTYLASAERLQVASTDVDDDGAPVGNGARTITITGLDSSYDVLTEVVTMNGQTNVLTDASFLRVNSVAVTTAGSTGYNEGTITISNNGDSLVLEQIDIQENASMAAAYTVPNGYTFYAAQAMATEASSKGSEFGFWVRAFGGLWAQKRGIVLLDSSIVVPIPLPMKIPQKADVEIRAKAFQAGAHVTAGFDGWIEAN